MNYKSFYNYNYVYLYLTMLYKFFFFKISWLERHTLRLKNIKVNNTIRRHSIKDSFEKWRALVSDVFTTTDEDGRWRDDLYLMRVRFSCGSAQDALRGSRLRHPIFGSRTDVREGVGAGEGKVRPPKTYYLIYDSHGHYLLVTKWTSRFFDTIRACIYSPWWKKKGGTPFGQETSTKDTHNTVVAQFCGREYGGEGGLLSLRSLITRAS